jgi:divalent metal cation (Fe/Co/Zn/Cd) transporter
MPEPKMKPIWFFVGMILLVIGGIIFLNGIYLLFHPPVIKTVLADMHPDIWWGAIMILFGGVLFLKTRNQLV